MEHPTTGVYRERVTSSTGFLFILAGAAFAIIGLLVLAGGLGWFGRLPGDVHISHGNVSFFAPLISMVVVSVVLTLLLNIFGRLR